MRLWRALGTIPGEIVAFTGGGGKTSLARCVAEELRAAGRPAIFTTTAKIYPAAGMDLVLASGESLEDVRRSLAAGRNVCLAERVEEETGKLIGVAANRISSLAALGAGAILVEADGSRTLPLKAPAEHEPVIPPSAGLVVPVAGASALGRALAPDVAHRPEAVAAAAGVAAGSPITPAVMAAAMLACCKGAPPGARVVPVLSQADLPEATGGLEAAADLLVGRSGIGRVVLAAPRTAEPVRRVVGDVAALVLAGGASRRFQGRKLLHAWAGGTIIEASLQAPLRAGLRETVVVTGAYHRELSPILARYPVRVAANPDWAEGMASSMRTGLQALSADPPRAVLICLADQPLLSPAVITAVAEAYRRTGARIVAPTAGGARQNPVLFDWSLAEELLAVQGDEGGRAVLARHRDELVAVDWPDPSVFRDIDLPSDLEV